MSSRLALALSSDSTVDIVQIVPSSEIAKIFPQNPAAYLGVLSQV